MRTSFRTLAAALTTAFMVAGPLAVVPTQAAAGPAVAPAGDLVENRWDRRENHWDRRENRWDRRENRVLSARLHEFPSLVG